MSSNVYRVVLSGTALVRTLLLPTTTVQDEMRFRAMDRNRDGLLTEGRHPAVSGCGLSGRRMK